VGEVARMLTPDLARSVVAGEPDLLVELEYGRTREMAVTAEDSLLRRTRLGLFHPRLLEGSRNGERGVSARDGL
jgi:glycerol-3-phosphate dehydrogenase